MGLQRRELLVAAGVLGQSGCGLVGIGVEGEGNGGLQQHRSLMCHFVVFGGVALVPAPLTLSALAVFLPL